MNIIKKNWGQEEIIVNLSYCGKRMTLQEGCCCSLHKHNIKDETFYVDSGEMLLEVVENNCSNFRILTRGESFRIEPGTLHRFYGIEDTVFYEFSTTDDSADSIRSISSQVGMPRDMIRSLVGLPSSREKILSIQDLKSKLEVYRRLNKTLVFTNGCFDVLHSGHIELLEKAKKLGDILIVGLNSDSSVQKLNKGKNRPIRKQNDRARILQALSVVDFVVIFNDPDPGLLIEQLEPDILVKGGDWQGKQIAGQTFVESHGGKVVFVELLAGYSTTSELEYILSAKE